MGPVWWNSYPREVNPAPPIPHGSVADLIRDTCRRFSDREAYWSTQRSMTFGETYALAEAVAAWLQQQGIVAGERVGIMLPNVLAFPVVTYGVLLAGCVAVTANPHYTPRELTHQLNDAGARALFVWEPAVAAVDKALPALRVAHLVIVSPTALLDSAVPPRHGARDTVPSRQWLEQVLAAGRTASVVPVPTEPARAAFLQYTGGTTGISKGAVLTERNVRAQLAQQLAWTAPFRPTERAADRLITAMPLYHVAALMAGMFRRFIDGGSCVLIADPRNLDALIRIMATQRFTLMAGVNTLYNALLNHPRIGDADFSSCAFSMAGAVATQQRVVDRWHALTGMSIIEGYGLTETCCYVSQQALDGRPFNGSVGLPLPLTEVSVRDSLDTEVPLGELGEICVRGPQVMAGYWNRPEETAAVITEDGYLRTGDIGRLDRDGYLRLADRKKDMILVSGFNVFPNEIEAVLLQHPKVQEAAVIAMADAHSGQVPVAFVVKRDASLQAAELQTYCAEQLTGYKRPKHIVFRDTLPKSPVGKILRRALREP